MYMLWRSTALKLLPGKYEYFPGSYITAWEIFIFFRKWCNFLKNMAKHSWSMGFIPVSVPLFSMASRAIMSYCALITVFAYAIFYDEQWWHSVTHFARFSYYGHGSVLFISYGNPICINEVFQWAVKHCRNQDSLAKMGVNSLCVQLLCPACMAGWWLYMHVCRRVHIRIWSSWSLVFVEAYRYWYISQPLLQRCGSGIPTYPDCSLKPLLWMGFLRVETSREQPLLPHTRMRWRG